MNFQELVEAKLRMSRNVSLNHFISLVENQTINKENFNKFIEILKKYDRFDEIENYSNLIKSVQKHIDLNFKITDENDKCSKNCEEKIGYEYKNEEEDEDDEEYEDDYDEDNFSEEEFNQYSIEISDLAEEEIAKDVERFSKDFSVFENVHDFLIQVYEYFKDLADTADAIYEPLKDVSDKLYGDSYFYEGDKYSSIMGLEDTEYGRIFKKSYYELFIRFLENLEVSKKDLIALIEWSPLDVLTVVLDADKYKESRFNDRLKKIQEIYDASVEETKYVFESETSKDLAAFKSDICTTLKVDQNFLNTSIELSCLISDFFDSNLESFDITEERKLELIDLIKNNEIARNRMIQILKNHLIDNYDFKSLTQHLKKTEKKNLMNI